MSRPRLIALLLALTTLLVYLPVTRDSFVDYDDQVYVTENNTVQNGLTWAGVKWAFTTGPREQLASAHLALAHDGLRTLRP